MTNLTLRNNRVPSLFGSFGTPFFSSFLDEVLDNIPVTRSKDTVPAVNVSTTDTSYNIELACPGLSKNELNIEIKGNTTESFVLAISYDRKEESENSFLSSSFQRRWTLPKDSDADNIAASYNQGIFKVTVPRIPPVQPTTTKIEVI